MEISIAAETIGHISSFPINNSLIASWSVMAILITGAIVIRSKLATIPRGIQNITEVVIESLNDLIVSVVGDTKKAEKFFPLLATFFLFILFSNWLGIFPGFGSIIIHELKDGESLAVPILRSVNADLNMTLALAIISVIATQIFGFWANGLGYLKKFFNFTNPIMFAVGLLEIVSEFAKVLSFSFRLFGNVFAGEVLLTIVGSIVAYFAPLPFYVLEIFVGFVQALVFTMLTLVFLTISTSHQEH